MGLTAVPNELIAPKELADGRVVWDVDRGAEETVNALRAYDARCSLVRNHVDHQWEVWRKNEDQSASRVGVCRQERLPHGAQLVAALAAHDTRRGYDPVAEMFAADDAFVRAQDAEMNDRGEEMGDKLHYALSKDLSAHAPAVRPMPLGDGRR